MTFCCGALVAWLLCLAARPPRPGPLPVTGLAENWILAFLLCLVFMLGALLLVLAVLTWRAPELDELPSQSQGERQAREGRWVVWVGVLLPLFTAVFLFKGLLPVDGMLVPALAMQVVTLWGGGRVLIAAGGARRPARQFLLGGITVLFASCAAAALEYLVWLPGWPG